ncbi:MULTISPECIES: FAD-dependent oxidoreductase [Nostocales]|uniref:FAD-dependent oxidoreductase n=3 Tax=Nostocales TaxID=1161 RepID=A0A8S9TGP4_9CYAN|nr:FAD-dependent oxidoreductase [Tolypothrix bouteillei]KAF3890363.1 FAD-dependent oxidoreductase [Tolypothrix bouteillei VB521301]
MSQVSVPSTVRTYDIICFGDEVPGILALVCAVREYYRQKNQYPRTLLLFKGNAKVGIGGHLVRGRLSYLNRCVVPPAIRQSLNLEMFGDPPAIYHEFLQRAGVEHIALDPDKADAVLREMLYEARVEIESNIEIESAIAEGKKIKGIKLTKDETCLGKQFIDCTVNAELALSCGVKKLKGFQTFGLPDSELAVTLVFETYGLSIEKLQNLELDYLQFLTNPVDPEARKWIDIAAGGSAAIAKQLREDLLDEDGNLKTMIVGKDYIDIRSRAISIAYHAVRGTPIDIESGNAVFDKGKITILSKGRLSWNALLYKVNAEQAEGLARAKAKPTLEILNEMLFVRKWFESIGASEVKHAPELYIRHAGNILGAVKPLCGYEMLAGGVPKREALGTFGYHFNTRSGIEGLDRKVTEKSFDRKVLENPPLFNIGIQHALIKDVPNLAVISPASGFIGYACLPGRIVEFNSAVGQGVGIAAGIAIAQQRDLAEISNLEVRNVLAQTGRLSQIYGTSNAHKVEELEDFELEMAVQIGSNFTLNSFIF